MIFKSRKFWNLIGMAIGAALSVAGIVFMANPPEFSSTRSTDYATFGGDFYTYEYDATRAAAVNAASTANNVQKLGEVVVRAAGIAMMAAGALTVVYYGKDTFATDGGNPEDTNLIPAEKSAPEASVWGEIEREGQE